VLDLAHPQTALIFEASGLEEKIRPHLLAWLNGAPFEQRREVLDTWLPQLHELNRRGFGNSPAIAATLDRLAEAVRGTDPGAAWQGFLDLAETPGDNFGTWAI
jgi:hypothetical protein